MLGDRLAYLRMKQNWTQQDVATRLSMNRGTYAHYETNKREPDGDTLLRLADLYEVTADYLLRGSSSAETGKGVTLEEREFLTFIEQHLTGSFFYDFSRSPEDQKSEMMRTLRVIWEMEKQRRPGQKQGE